MARPIPFVPPVISAVFMDASVSYDLGQSACKIVLASGQSFGVKIHSDNEPVLGTFPIFVSFMRIIARNTIRNFWEAYPETEQELRSWVQEAEHAKWESPQKLKQQYGHASIITGKRIVFNINGNRYRLIVDIEFRLQIIFVVWFGNHKEYDAIDVKTISYVKTDKNK